MTSTPYRNNDSTPLAILDRQIKVIKDADGRGASLTRVSDLRPYPYVVLLGEPGSGKSSVLASEATREGVNPTTVRAVMTSPPIATPVLYLDALDEYRIDGQASDKVYGLAAAIANAKAARWRLTCRAEDWRNASDSEALSGTTDGTPIVVVQLLALTCEEASQILLGYGEQFPQNFLTTAINFGAAGFLESPLSLRLLHDAVIKGGAWPKNRYELFDNAIEQLAHEPNPRRSRQDRSPVPKIIDAAEVASLTLLISGSHAIWRSNAEPPVAGDDTRAYLRAYELNLDQQVMRDTLDSSLFTGEGEVFRPMHRTVAEYLGGRALAKAVTGTPSRAALPLARARAMITGSDHMPPSELRGVYAWFCAHLSKLSDTPYALQLIHADPATVLLYGDTRSFATPLRRAILQRLGAPDPFFRTFSIPDGMVGNLVGDDLEPELRDILNNAVDETQRLATVFEALVNAPPIQSLRPLLHTIALDTKRDSWQRARATIAWTNGASTQEIRSLFDALSAQAPSREREDVRLQLATRIPCNLLSVSDIQAILLGTETTALPNSVGRLISFSTRLQSSPPTALFEAPLDKWLPRQPGGTNSIEIQGFIDTVLAASIANSDLLTGDTIWRWASNVRRHAWESLQDRSMAAVCRWIDADPSRERELFDAILKSRMPNDATWKVASDFRHITGRTVSPSVIQGLLDTIKSAPDKPESIQLLEIIVNIAGTHPDPSLHQAILDYVSTRSDGAAHVQHLTAKSAEAEELRLAEADEKRLAREHEQRGNNIQTLFPLLNDLSTGKCIGYLEWAALNYFARPNPSGSSDKTTGLDRVLQYTNAEITKAIETGWRHLATTDLGGLTAAKIGTASATSRHYLVETAALAGLDRLLLAQGDQPLPALHITLAIAVLNTSFVAEDPDRRNSLETWAIQRLDQDPQKGADQLLEFWTSALDANAVYFQSLHSFATKQTRNEGAFVLALDKLLSSRPDMPAALLDRALFIAGKQFSSQRLLVLAEMALANTRLKPAARRTWSLVAFSLDPTRHRDRFIREHNTRTELEQMQDSLRVLGPQSLKPMNPEERIERTTVIAQLVARVQAADEQIHQNLDPSIPYLGDLVSNALQWLSEQPSLAAGQALQTLTLDPSLNSWKTQLRYRHADWARGYRERMFAHPTPKAIAEALSGQSPLNAADLRAVVLEELLLLQNELHTSDITLWKHYWNRNKGGSVIRPLVENQCRDVLLSLLRTRLRRYLIGATLPEAQQAEGTRADVLILNGAGRSLPIEVKRHNHTALWDAAHTQLRGYMSSQGASGTGVYLVFWFGSKLTGIPSRPDGQRVTSAVGLQKLLVADLPSDIQNLIDVVVFDVSIPALPAKAAKKKRNKTVPKMTTRGGKHKGKKKTAAPTDKRRGTPAAPSKRARRKKARPGK